MSSNSVEVLEPGLLTTVQDPFGRPAFRQYGVPVAGALDPLAARLANRLAANRDAAALLEITLAGSTLRLSDSTLVGLAGADLSAVLDDRPMPPGVSRIARPRSLIRFGERRSGARAYLAFGGGIDVPVVLGSRSTDLRSGFGGFEGRALRAGDLLALGDASPRAAPRRARVPSVEPGADPVRILPGPHPDRFEPDALERLCAQRWTVSPQSDRAGCRLDGQPLTHQGALEIASVGVPLGTIQVPPDGLPIVLLADRPVTGGYPVLGVVARVDIGRVAQLLPGDEPRFAETTREGARRALAEQEALALDLVIDAEAEADAGWAGSLG